MLRSFLANQVLRPAASLLRKAALRVTPPETAPAVCAECRWYDLEAGQERLHALPPPYRTLLKVRTLAQIGDQHAAPTSDVAERVGLCLEPNEGGILVAHGGRCDAFQRRKPS